MSARAVGRPAPSAATTTSSTRRSTGTGLKKWMPMTCSGRLRRHAELHDRDRRGVRRQDRRRVGRRPCRGRVNTSVFSRLVLDDRLDDELAVGELGEIGGDARSARGRRRGRPRRACPPARPGRATWSPGRSPASAAPASTSRTTTSRPGPGAHLGDARPHEAATHHSDSFERVSHGCMLTLTGAARDRQIVGVSMWRPKTPASVLMISPRLA